MVYENQINVTLQLNFVDNMNLTLLYNHNVQKECLLGAAMQANYFMGTGYKPLNV
jgi:hypothetical protein